MKQKQLEWEEYSMYSKEVVLRTNKDGKKFEIPMIFGTGRLTNDPPELRTLDSGVKVLSGQKGHNFSIAFNRGKEKEALFYRIEAWERTAELLSQFGFKGQLIEVAGKIKVEKYKNADGEERTAEVLVVERFDVKEYKEGKGESNSANESMSNGASDENPFDSSSMTIDISDDDLPF